MPEFKRLMVKCPAKLAKEYLTNALPTRKISVNGHFFNPLIAPFVSSQKLYNMLYPAASQIQMRADTLEDITLFFFFSQTHSHHLNNALFMLIYLPFYLHV